MTRFEEEMMSLGENRKKARHEGAEVERDAENRVPYPIKQAMRELFNLVDSGVRAYNKGLGGKGLSVYELPEEILKMFFNLTDGRTGFCVIAPQKFVVFLNEKPDQVVVLGKRKQNERGPENGLIGARQLIKITCLKSGDGLGFRDNTGAALDLEDIVAHIIRWSVSE